MKAKLFFTLLPALAWKDTVGAHVRRRNQAGQQLHETGQFNIQLMNMGSNKDYDEAFEFAKARWESVIVNDLPDAAEGSVDDWFAGWFDTPVNVAVDDLLIGYSIAPIDKPGVIGAASPIYYRTDILGTTPVSAVSGIMYFDEDLLAQMAPDDVKLEIMHEMGHILGLGSFWPYKCGVNCELGLFGYTCPKAIAEYKKLGFQGELLLENDGGPGTACGHWDEISFADPVSSELMTGKFESHKGQPMSSVTLAALEDDLGGYVVNYNVTEQFHRTSIDLEPSMTFSLLGHIETLPMQPLKL